MVKVLFLFAILFLVMACSQQSGNRSAAVAAAGGMGGELSQLLQSSNWCHFEYRSIGGNGSGTEINDKAIFGQNGVVTLYHNGSTYSSGSGGQYYGENPNTETAYWKADGSQLSLSSDGANWKAYPVQVTKNNNGYPILNMNGQEWTSCN